VRIWGSPWPSHGGGEKNTGPREWGRISKNEPKQALKTEGKKRNGNRPVEKIFVSKKKRGAKKKKGQKANCERKGNEEHNRWGGGKETSDSKKGGEWELGPEEKKYAVAHTQPKKKLANEGKEATGERKKFPPLTEKKNARSRGEKGPNVPRIPRT